MWPSGGMVKWFGENVRWILFGVNEVKAEESRSNSFTDAMVGEGIPTLGKCRVWECGTGDDALVVAKHPGWAIKGHPKETESAAEINDLFRGDASGNKLAAISGCLNLGLTFGETIDGSLVDKVEDAGG